MQSRPSRMELIKCALLALCGLAGALQPWLAGLRWLGWPLLFLGCLLFFAQLLKVLSARRVLASPLADFACGAQVFREGVLFEGQLHNFSTFATMLTAVELLEDRLVFTYSYAVKGKRRANEVLAVPLEENETEKAQSVLAAFGFARGNAGPGPEDPPSEKEEP